MQQYAVVGFLDDDPHRVGHKLCGVPVKHGPEWLRQPWNTIPEIWISSRFIPEERAQQLVTQWDGRIAVRRLRLHVEPVLSGQSAVPNGRGISTEGTSVATGDG
jgi:hypothetical protein